MNPENNNTSPAILDRFGRAHTALRISVTDRCNIRCFYCMPDESIRFLPSREILSFEEITSLVGILAGMGIRKLRVTGGEPLVRSQLHKLIEKLVAIPGIVDVALTTNGILLEEQAQSLRDAGLHRLNISLDTLREEVFQRITRRSGLDRVLRGIERARQVGFDKIRLNAIAMSGLTETEVIPLAEFARQQGLELRFIEFMPLDAEQAWQPVKVLSGSDIRQMIEQRFGPLEPVESADPSQPARNFAYADGGGQVGLINPVTEPFCDACNRLRLTAEGKLRNCLFSTAEWDVRSLLRSGATTTEIDELVRECVAAKKRAHGINGEAFERPAKAMYQIGG
ncbi:MAG: GTP 3',8-cyclase MoaA [Mariniblastus sp.]|nr:GTP 3',8-cyclase MoaA [Mariniblastus sp.]